MPPAPSGEMTSYGPSLVPLERPNIHLLRVKESYFEPPKSPRNMSGFARKIAPHPSFAESSRRKRSSIWALEEKEMAASPKPLVEVVKARRATPDFDSSPISDADLKQI